MGGPFSTPDISTSEIITAPEKSHSVNIEANSSPPANAAGETCGDLGCAQKTAFTYGAQWLLRLLGNRWTFPILLSLRSGPMRFAKLKRTLDPISQRMLTLSLRRLEQDDLVYRKEVFGQPPQVSYGLTPLGVALLQRLGEFEVWLDAHKRALGRNQRKS